MTGRLTWRRWLSAAAIGLAFAGLALVGDGLYIKVKAHLAQHLLAQAWAATTDGAERARPWPWADTWPVARLAVPAHDVEQIVLAGASGRTLAFGPGHHSGSATPGAVGLTILTGHRDTHFAFLQRLAIGDGITLTTPDGVRHGYHVTETQVVHKDDARFRQPAPGNRVLALVTCWPYDAVVPGGPLRHVVVAQATDHTASQNLDSAPLPPAQLAGDGPVKMVMVR